MDDNQPDPEPEPGQRPTLDLQDACGDLSIPSQAQLLAWYSACLPEIKIGSEITVRIVDEEESKTLNSSFRQKHKPTNVLSFPAEIPEELNIPFLGDLVICANIVKRESHEQSKPEEAHWAHMIVHGTLHLLGYDHEQDDEAEEMETLEALILNKLGFDSPYESAENTTNTKDKEHER